MTPTNPYPCHRDIIAFNLNLIIVLSIRPFATLQKLRHSFVPGTPVCLADVANTKVSLKKAAIPIKDELTVMFPTLLANGADGMQQL